MCKLIHLVCQLMKRKNYENIITNNTLTNLERTNGTTMIVSQLNNSTKPLNDL